MSGPLAGETVVVFPELIGQAGTSWYRPIGSRFSAAQVGRRGGFNCEFRRKIKQQTVPCVLPVLERQTLQASREETKRFASFSWTSGMNVCCWNAIRLVYTDDPPSRLRSRIKRNKEFQSYRRWEIMKAYKWLPEHHCAGRYELR